MEEIKKKGKKEESKPKAVSTICNCFQCRGVKNGEIT